MSSTIIVIILIVGSSLNVFANIKQNNYEKYVGFEYNINNIQEISNQKYILFADYSFVNENTIIMNMKTNMESLKDVNMVKFTKRNMDYFVANLENGVYVTLDLHSDSFLLNFQTQSKNILFSNLNVYDIVKYHLNSKEHGGNNDSNDLSISPMSFSLEDILDGWEIVDGPSITNKTYSSTPEYNAVRQLLKTAIFSVGGPAAFLQIVVDYVYDKIYDNEYGGTYTKTYNVRDFYADGPGTLSLYQYAWKTVIYSSSIMSDYYLETVKTQYDGGIRLAEE